MKPGLDFRVREEGEKAMIITLLAAAMTVAMLIATAFGLHQETQQLRYLKNRSKAKHFGPR